LQTERFRPALYAPTNPASITSIRDAPHKTSSRTPIPRAGCRNHYRHDNVSPLHLVRVLCTMGSRLCDGVADTVYLEIPSQTDKSPQMRCFRRRKPTEAAYKSLKSMGSPSFVMMGSRVRVTQAAPTKSKTYPENPVSQAGKSKHLVSTENEIGRFRPRSTSPSRSPPQSGFSPKLAVRMNCNCQNGSKSGSFRRWRLMSHRNRPTTISRSQSGGCATSPF
jgi:hypothetical protein